MKTEHFKQKLEAEKGRLEIEMKTVGRKSATVPDDWEASPEEDGMEADLIDQADVVVTRENNAAVLADLEARYDTILTTLHKIEEGKYGICDVCGEEIEEARLEANPAAATCAAHMR